MWSVDCNIVMQHMTVLFTLCHSDMFQPSKDHPQGVGQIRYNSKMSYQMQNELSKQHVVSSEMYHLYFLRIAFEGCNMSE